MRKEEQGTAMRVLCMGIAVNVLLSVFKFAASIFAHSGAMLSDAMDSASDVFSNLIVIAGVRMSNKTDDEDHPYGHERLESVAAMIMAAVLTVVGAGIGFNGVRKIIFFHNMDIEVPGMFALVAAIVAIIVKECMFWFTRSVAKKINSDALMADAWHHRSDALSSVGSLVGVGGAMLGFPILDPLASVVICIFIIKAAIGIFIEAVNKMVDKACDAQTVQRMKNLILSHEEVKRLDDLRTRMFGSRIFVDVEFSVDGTMLLKDAHEVAQQVHDEIESEFQAVKHCMVHVNPAPEE